MSHKKATNKDVHPVDDYGVRLRLSAPLLL